MNQFTEKYLQTARHYIPVRKIKTRSKDKLWVTAGLRKLIRLHNRWSGTYNRTKRDERKIIQNAYRSRVKNELRRLKNGYFERHLHKLNESTLSCKTFWSIAKHLYGNKIKQPIPTLVHGNRHYTLDVEKATLLNDYFTQQSTLPPPSPDFSLPQFQYITQSRLTDIEFTPYQVQQIISKLPVNKASGPDLVSNQLLKCTSDTICEPLAIIFNKSLSSCTYPQAWKCANLTSVFKKNDNTSRENYRPISLLSCISKIMERLVFNEMYEYFVRNRLLNTRNSGFKKLDSTVNQLVHIVNNIYKGIDNHHDVCMIFLDISKAFDKVYHEGLLYKLKQLGIEGNLLKWLESYLSGRTQRVLVNGKASDWCTTNAGVPQGSILGPLLFLVYINDIIENIQSEIYIFADDTSLMRPIKNEVIDFDLLNEDLTQLHTWAQKWRVTFNATKTEYMIFSNKNTIPVYPDLFLGNTKIKQVENHTHLGLTMDRKLDWKNHVSRISTKAGQRVSNIKRIRQSQEKLYTNHWHIHFLNMQM